MEQATGLTSEARESISLGGDYYSFKGLNGEQLSLLVNKDVYDGEPVVTGADSWPVVLMLDSVQEKSQVVQSLLADAQHFRRL